MILESGEATLQANTWLKEIIEIQMRLFRMFFLMYTESCVEGFSLFFWPSLGLGIQRLRLLCVLKAFD